MSYQGREAIYRDQDYIDPNPLPSSVPPVDELGATSAPLKSASFFIGQHCKDVNGAFPSPIALTSEDFMLCKQENRDPAHCLREGRKVTRCAAEVLVECCFVAHHSVNMIRENCLAEFDAHWKCLEQNNQVGMSLP